MPETEIPETSAAAEPESAAPEAPAETVAEPATAAIAAAAPEEKKQDGERPRHPRRPHHRRRGPRPGAGPVPAFRAPTAAAGPAVPAVVDARFDWQRIAHTLLISRALDGLEETRLYPAKKVLYQFSARGHELGQILLGTMLIGPHDAASGYYRSRPLLLTLGLSAADALAGDMALTGSVSEGRDIGAVYNLPRPPGQTGVIVLPMAGGVGTQYTTTAGWARAIVYYRDELRQASYKGSIAVVLGGEASAATNGFWSALNIAATERLPMLFYIEDNGYGISVPGTRQTPGGNIAQNLASFRNLRVWDGDGTDPADAIRCLIGGVSAARNDRAPALVRLRVPRLCGHSGQDSQAYKSAELLAAERGRDPLPRLRTYLVPARFTPDEWRRMERAAQEEVETALAEAERRAAPEPATVAQFVMAPQPRPAPVEPATAGVRLNMVAAIRRTVETEMERNPLVLTFGEDVGPKGGVHTATEGLQTKFGPRRVFDTSLSEEGIIGSAVGMGMAGLRPVAEIQFRKYADPATEQLHDCGTMRWRTANRFSAPIVVRMPGGFFKCGDPWHSQSDEVAFARALGWQVLFPSNAADAAGLLRAALRSENPSIFFEHRHLLDAASARRPYPGDDYVLPLGKAACLQTGTDLTLITWGAMVERCLEAAAAQPGAIEILDLRTLMPWDQEAVLASVRKTARSLIVHEDTRTAGFGAEIAAVIAQEAFSSLDAPVERLTVPDVPMPYNVGLMNALLPSVETIRAAIARVLAY
ncbi:MAG: transketolase C-terminal domain-containing protein [Terriglobales bacterium]